MAKKKDEKFNKTVLSIVLFVAGLVVGGFATAALFTWEDINSDDDGGDDDDVTFVERGYEIVDFDHEVTFIDSYAALQAKIIEQEDENTIYRDMPSEEDFSKGNYLAISYEMDDCNQMIKSARIKRSGSDFGIYYDVINTCGVCASSKHVDFFNIEQYQVSQIKVMIFEKTTRDVSCDDMTVKKPIVYIYPTEEMDLTVRLGHPELLSSTYPKYESAWSVHVTPDGNIYDYVTGRNYYALYWEGHDTTELDMKEGFVVAGSDTVKFLEEKLAILGLNEREINEFITYWIAKMENNPYNYIHFRTVDEINAYIPLEFSKNPDTLIRVIVDFKALDKPVKVAEQKLQAVERQGFTVVEWGGKEY